MTTTVLAYFPSPGQGVWYLGPFPIRAYALCIIAGIIAALVIGDRRWAARGGERGVIYDIALWAVPFGLVGGRLYHLMTDWKTYFGPGGAGIGAAARIWEGGLGIWGAVALGAVGAWIGCRRKGIPLPAFGDAVAPGIVLAQAIGRLGNYFNQELYGRETTVPWGMEIFYRRDSSGVVDVHSLDGVSTGQVAAVVHPTFLYELLWNLLVFVFLIWADRKFRLGHGRLFALYVAAYCVGRFGIELMRDDTATHIAGIRVNVFTSVFVFIGALVYFLLAPKGRENPESLRGHRPLEPEHESKVEEWAEDLVAAAKGSGIVAAATVAGEHETEDSDAVGDLETDAEKTDFILPVGAEDAGAEDYPETDEDVEGEPEGQPDSDEAVVVFEGATETEAVVVYESTEELPSGDVGEEAAVDEDRVEVAVDDEVESESPDEATEHKAPAAEAEAVDEQAESEIEPEPAAEAVDDEPEPEPEAEAEPVAEAEAEPEAEAEAEPEPEAEAEPEPVAEEPEPEPVAEEPEPEPEPTPAPEADSVAATAKPAPVVAEEADGTEEAPEPKLGLTLKRLLWGASKR